MMNIAEPTVNVGLDGSDASERALEWALAEETVFMSAMNGDEPQRSFRFIDPENNGDDKRAMEAMKDSTGFSFCFVHLTPGDLNRVYFHPDTTQPYVVTSYTEFAK